MHPALLIIDIQNDYFPGGAMELVGSNAAARNAAQLLAAFRARNRPVIHVQHIATEADAPFFRAGTTGADMHPDVTPQPHEIVVQKHYPNSFRETTLLQQLQALKVDSLVIVGMMTHMCVDSSVRAAADLGFECRLAHDACATCNLAANGRTVSAADVQASFIAALDGTFATVHSTSTFLHALENNTQ
ncbi:MAG: cysteine hydrolase [Nevskiaceae bacterium]|nr:MAG: cysteine hydrolase [Nevskiaceae bacterium]TBR73725.1 MAG: cysteine hydrolase [Nevskiaceae bacterium]